MKIKIVAMSDREIFAGTDEDGNYSVIGLDDSKPIELGDVLSCANWDDRGGLFKSVRNVTKQQNVRICIEDWECTKARALRLLKTLNRPTKIFYL